jgi:5-methylcytosine-specific restriction endonuclease McrA
VLDNSPKKPCKTCGLKGHYTYKCYANPKRGLKRMPIKARGKETKQWLVTRATWIRNNPPPIDGKYWLCYLRISPMCPVHLTIKNITLDHVVSRRKDPKKKFSADNLKPACYYCNNEKGSRSLEKVRGVPADQQMYSA